MYKGDVYIETGSGQIVQYPLVSLSKEDQDYALKRHQQIATINYQLTHPVSANNTSAKPSVFNIRLLLSVFIILVLALLIYKTAPREQLKYLYPVLLAGIVTMLSAFSADLSKSLRALSTSPTYIDSAFTPYKHNVITSWDSTYFYVGSYGIPAHEMMAGITAWNQQVPIPQC